tara:strand:- start:78 stop:263 length:186 start_codon:yes stop_codon:yes gene_type:complete
MATKQTLTSGPYPNQSFIAVFDTAAEITGKPANKGFMAYCLADNKLYIYTGSAWKKSAAFS